jgi:hypothetical protein
MPPKCPGIQGPDSILGVLSLPQGRDGNQHKAAFNQLQPDGKGNDLTGSGVSIT